MALATLVKIASKVDGQSALANSGGDLIVAHEPDERLSRFPGSGKGVDSHQDERCPC
jgi:hypothetical protein